MMIGCMLEVTVSLHFYNQLPKGKRTFYLKTTDTNGLWSNYIAEIQVSKEPAFYETWWAYMFYVVLVILSLYLFLSKNEETFTITS